jgi:hypothetical protein
MRSLERNTKTRAILLLHYLANGLMWRSRKLSDQIMFIRSTTKMAPGMSARFQVALFSGSNRLVQAHGPKLGGRIKGATVYERLVGQAALDPLADIGKCGGGDASPGTEEDNDDAFDVGL